MNEIRQWEFISMYDICAQYCSIMYAYDYIYIYIYNLYSAYELTRGERGHGGNLNVTKCWSMVGPYLHIEKTPRTITRSRGPIWIRAVLQGSSKQNRES